MSLLFDVNIYLLFKMASKCYINTRFSDVLCSSLSNVIQHCATLSTVRWARWGKQSKPWTVTQGPFLCKRWWMFFTAPQVPKIPGCLDSNKLSQNSQPGILFVSSLKLVSSFIEIWYLWGLLKQHLWGLI